MLFSSRSYAIGMAHHQMAGGFRTVGILLGGYVVIVGGVIGLIAYQTDIVNLWRAFQGLFTFLFVVEAFLLVVVGALRVAGCIRIDVTTGMIESHRLMPLTPARAVLGYLFGTTTHVLSLVALNVLTMAALAPVARVSLDNFLIAQIVLALFALFTWTFAAVGTMIFKQALPLMVLGLIFGSCASTLLRRWGILPGISILASPFLGETIFNLSGGRITMRAAYPLAFATQAAFSVTFFLAACRRYRDAFAIAFNVPLGIALLAVWGLLTALGIRVWPEELVGPMGRDFDQPPLYGQIVAGVGVSALLMLVPLFALGTGDPRRPFKKGTQLALLAPIVLVGLLPVAGGSLDIPRTFLTLLVMGCHGMIMLAFFRMCRGRTPVFLGGVVLLYLLIVWLVPLFLEFVRYQFFASRIESQFESEHWTVLGTLSPIGLMITAWSTEPDQPSPWVGVALQLVLAALAWHFGFARKTPMPPPGAAAPTPASTDGASSTGAAGHESELKTES